MLAVRCLRPGKVSSSIDLVEGLSAAKHSSCSDAGIELLCVILILLSAAVELIIG